MIIGQHVPIHAGVALQIVRERQRRFGDVLFPRRIQCVICKRRKVVEDFFRIQFTGIVQNVTDCVCSACHKEHGREASRLPRIVCVGCKEVVYLKEPEREASGFVWKEFGFCHVLNCPECSGDAGLRMSQIAEKVAFYKANGIPYEL